MSSGVGSAQQWPVAAIFDCDGLLLDTSELWRSAYERVLEEQGRTLQDQAIAALHGASVGGAARALDVPQARLQAALEAAFATAAPSPLPGVRKLLDTLGSRLRLAVATNGPAQAIESALRAAGLLEYFDEILSPEQQLRPKPAPDVYLAACEALQVDPSDAIAFEDSAVGVTSARRAGLVVVYVPSSAPEATDADLQARRLDDAPLLSLLGCSTDQAHPDGRLHARHELERVCRLILTDQSVSGADPAAIHELCGTLQRCLILWRRARLAQAEIPATGQGVGP